MGGIAMILVIARLTGVAEKRDEFLAVVSGLIKGSQAEQGCISYRFYENPEVPNDFVFIEEWESQAILDRHHTEPHFKAFADKIGTFLVGEPEVKSHDV
jgi:quinol monooxygenase YgiN